jgi:DNA-directed RNA polymerase subunit B
MASISVKVDSEEIMQFLYGFGVIPTQDASVESKAVDAKVFVDGSFIGYSNNAEALVTSFRTLRRSGGMTPEANIAYYRNEGEELFDEVYVNCGAGRVRRPLIIVENGQPQLTSDQIAKLKLGDLEWRDLIRGGIIDYLDAEEEENALIALDYDHLTPQQTHMEIAPYTMLGICTAVIPYPEHNQSPRNSYEAAMAKQALGMYSTNYFNRVDTQFHVLHYPQLPLVKTKPMDVLGYYNRPPGQNYVVAVISFGGYNMEDALIFNKASIQRGLGRSNFFRVYKAEGRRYLGGMQDKFEIPEAGTRGFRGEQYYRLLEEDGVISVESSVAGNSVLIGRSSPPRFLEEYRDFEVRGPTRRDTSVTMRATESGVVDDVFVMSSSQGSELVKVRVRDERIPELGDKFASRHGQKGVMGMLMPQEDMPFTEEGVMPDLLINPHAIPSRMTIGQFIEAIGGKAAALEGEIIDGTPFSNRKRSEIGAFLEQHGYHYGGREVMYNGVTGEKLEADIFMGVVYYQKLHHMVADKMHARARGQVQMLTRQPTEGRARGGGLRFGEMERDCLIGHGAAMLLKDRLLEESDKAIIFVCEQCGYLAYYDFRQRKHICKLCGDNATTSPIAISYAFKLLLQELMSLCISPKLVLTERA